MNKFFGYRSLLCTVIVALFYFLIQESAQKLSLFFPLGSNADADRLYILMHYEGILSPIVLALLALQVCFVTQNRIITIVLSSIIVLSHLFHFYELLAILPILFLAFESGLLKQQHKIFSTTVYPLFTEFLRSFFLASLVTLSLVIVIRVSDFKYSLHMLSISGIFIFPILVWVAFFIFFISYVGKKLDSNILGRLFFLSTLFLIVFLPTILITLSVGDTFIAKFHAYDSLVLLSLCLSLSFFALIDNPLNYIYAAKSDRTKIFSYLLDGNWLFIKVVLFGIMLKEFTRYIKDMEKDLVREFLVDLIYSFLPVFYFLVVIAIVRFFLTQKPKYLWLRYFFNFLIILLIVLPVFAFKKASWTLIPENYWPFGEFATKHARRNLSQLGVQDLRPMKILNLQLETQIKNNSGNLFSTTNGMKINLDKNFEIGTPHIFLFISDAVTKHRVSTYGYSRDTSPNLDIFAQESVLFKNPVSAATDTFQNVSSIFSGQYFGRYSGKSVTNTPLKSSEVTALCRVLRSKNYEIIFPQNAEGILPISEDCPKESGLSFTGGTKNDWEIIQKSFAKNPGKPHFVYIHVDGAHPPWYRVANLIYGDASRSDIYDAAVRTGDDEFGVFLTRLKNSGLYDDALIIFSADHGLGVGYHMDLGSFTRLYSTNIDIPLVVKIPKVTPRVVETLYSHVDLLPTIAELIGASILDQNLHGISLKHEILNPEKIKERCVFSIGAYQEAYASVCSNGQKIIYNRDMKSVSYFDWKNDPLDLTDLIETIAQGEFEEKSKPLANFVGYLDHRRNDLHSDN